jgi:site-specific DNA recombinase
VLGVVRLSRDRDDSTSVERQRAYVEAWAEQNGHEVIGWAEDVDVSGSVAPWERPGLGPWKARVGEWDILVAWRLDRVTRRVLHLAGLIEWCRDNGKALATTSEGFDINSAMGRVFVQILGALAEGELEAIRERTASSFRHLMKSGRWRGGFVPYGYRPARSDDGAGWRLEVDDETADTLREIVRRIVDEGQAANAVVRWLNTSGVPIPLDAQRLRSGQESRGGTWRVGNLLRMLRSHTLLGWAEMTETVKLPNGQTERVTRVVRADDGLPLQRAEALIERDEWDRLQAVLDRNSNKRAGNREGGSLLLRVAYCECGDPLYRVRGRSDWYYRCGRKARTSQRCPAGNPGITATELEGVVVGTFVEFAADVPIVRRVLVPGEDHEGELENIARAMRELVEDRQAGLYSSESGARTFRDMFAKLEAQEQTLRAMPSRADEWRDEPTGETYGERWAALEAAGERNRELRQAGIRAVLHAEPVSTPALFSSRASSTNLPGSRVTVTMPEGLTAAGAELVRVNAAK